MSEPSDRVEGEEMADGAYEPGMDLRTYREWRPRCIVHHEDGPCPTCRSYIAAGL